MSQRSRTRRQTSSPSMSGSPRSSTIRSGCAASMARDRFAPGPRHRPPRIRASAAAASSSVGWTPHRRRGGSGPGGSWTCRPAVWIAVRHVVGTSMREARACHPSTFSAHTRPFWATSSPRVMASPIPVPNASAASVCAPVEALKQVRHSPGRRCPGHGLSRLSVSPSSPTRAVIVIGGSCRRVLPGVLHQMGESRRCQARDRPAPTFVVSASSLQRDDPAAHVAPAGRPRRRCPTDAPIPARHSRHPCRCAPCRRCSGRTG